MLGALPDLSRAPSASQDRSGQAHVRIFVRPSTKGKCDVGRKWLGVLDHSGLPLLSKIQIYNHNNQWLHVFLLARVRTQGAQED